MGLLIHPKSRICWAGAGAEARRPTSAPHIAHVSPCCCPGGKGSSARRDKKGEKEDE